MQSPVFYSYTVCVFSEKEREMKREREKERRREVVEGREEGGKKGRLVYILAVKENLGIWPKEEIKLCTLHIARCVTTGLMADSAIY